MFGRYGYSTRGSPAQESSIRAFRLPGTGTLTIEISKIDMRFVRDGQDIKSRKVYEPDDINSMVQGGVWIQLIFKSIKRRLLAKSIL